MAFFTVGHSTRSLEELTALLHEHEVTLLADVRTIPGSRRMPHFSRAALASALPGRGVDYVHLVELGRDRRVAIMCAEAVPWRCHRSLIADALLVRGLEVCHILGPGSARPHVLTPFARVERGRLTYSAPASIDSE